MTDLQANTRQTSTEEQGRSESKDILNLPVAALEEVRYDKQTGLVPVVVQDAETEQVLTLAYANREALKRTLGTGQAWFWSRSRQEYWRKGATSGNVQKVVEVRVDCDADAVIYRVLPAGPACHTGEVSCFFRQLSHHADDKLKQTSFTLLDVDAANAVDAANGANPSSQSREVAQTPASVEEPGGEETVTSRTGTEHLTEVLEDLWAVIEDRFEKRPEGSYTTYLFEHGVDKVAKKVGEEAVEVALAAKNALTLGAQQLAGQQELSSESADLLYHLFALWKMAGTTPADVASVLAKRGTSSKSTREQD